MLVFNRNDIIRNNGHLIELTIHFFRLPSYDNIDENSFPHIFLYVIVPTKESNKFIIISRYQLSKEEIQSRRSNGNIQIFGINESTVYLENGEYLAVGFGFKSGQPYCAKGSDSYYIDLNTANTDLCTYKPVSFIKQAIYAATFSFKLTSARCL
jgi:hypothetical protein